MEDFAGAPFDEFRDRQRLQRLVNLLPSHAFVEHERKITPDGRKTRNFTRRRRAQCQLIEPVEVEFAKKNRLFEFACACFARMELAEPAHGDPIGIDARGTIRMKVCGWRSAWASGIRR